MSHYLYAMLRKRMGRRGFLSGVATLVGALAAACTSGGKNSKKADSYRNATPYDTEEASPAPATVFIRRWFGPSDAPGKVEWKGTEVLGAAAPDKVTVPLAVRETFTDGSDWAADVEKAYITSTVEPFRLLRFDPLTNTYTSYVAPAGYNKAWAVRVTGGKVYVPSGGPAGVDHVHVSVFNTADYTPSLVAVYEYDAAGMSANYGASLATDGTYLFLGTEGGQVLLIRLADMELVQTLTLAHPRWIHSIGYNPADGYIYAGGSGDAGVVSKISIDYGSETLTEVTHYHHNCGSMTDDLAFSPTHLWLGPEDESIKGQVLLIPLDTFASHELVTCGPSDADCNGSFLDWDGLHMWTTWWMGTHSQMITRTNLSDMTHQRLWLADDEINANEIIQYDSNKYLVVTYGSGAKVINLTDPFPDSGLKKPSSGSNYSYWVALRPYSEAGGEQDSGKFTGYTDGANDLGAGWTAVGSVAKSYVKPTGTAGVMGGVLNTTNYPSLEAPPVDIFDWTSASPKVVDGSVGNPNTGDLGTAGTDHSFLVIQLVASADVADGPSNGEVLTFTFQESGVTTTTSATVQGRASA